MDEITTTQPTNPIGDQRPGTDRHPRRLPRRRISPWTDEDDHTPHDLPAVPERPDPAQPLLEALDRLRVTHEVRPAELEFAKALRAMKAYQDPTTRFYRAENEPEAPPVT